MCDFALSTRMLKVRLFDPAVGFVFFEFEFGEGFDGVAGREGFGVVGVNF
jgi:hypothetical protein